tara:strand:+ start:12498 stop:13106 length:609 start_codon:yes stop_codon:yes gene_type:complete
MKFSKKKTYYPQTTWEFNLPAGHSCPYAKDCKIKVDKETGKFDTIGKKFRCYAASAERFPGVRKSRWENYEAVLRGEEIVIPKDVTHVRIHSSGDFFSQEYFDKWITICKNNPEIKFWAFTKSIQFWVNRLNEIPNNLTLQASKGSIQDDLIEKHNLKFAEVFKSLEALEKSGLPRDTDDAFAMEGTESFALLDNYNREKKK